MSAGSRALARLRGEPTIAYHVVKANPQQTLGKTAGAAEWQWGDEWQLGERHGRWVICVNSILETDLIRVEWDESQEVEHEYWFYHRLFCAIHDPADSDVSDAQDRAMQAARSFDRMATELWEQRDSPV